MDEEVDKSPHPPRAGRYLVAVTGSVNSAYLVRWTDATARSLGAAWTALHVGDPSDEDDRDGVGANMALAESLGADTAYVRDEDVAAAIARYARAIKASAIVMGKAGDDGLGRPGASGVVSAMLGSSGDIDLILLRGKEPVRLKGKGLGLSRGGGRLRGAAYAAGSLAAVTVLGLVGQPVLGYRSISILYLVAVIFLPFACSRTVVFASAALGTLLWNFLFIPPKMTFTIASLEDALMYAAFFVAAVVGGYMTSRLKEKESALSLRERRMAFLYGYTRAIARVRGADEMADFTVSYIKDNLGLRSEVWLRGGSGELRPVGAGRSGGGEARGGSAAPSGGGAAPKGDSGLASACARSGRSLADGDDRLYVPLASQDAAIGALYAAGDRGLGVEYRELLETLAGNLTLALEREALSEENERNKMASESARLSKVLLDHVSHELRTPLTTIKGSVSGLLEKAVADDAGLREALLADAMSAADKLDSLVEDLLDMSRLEAGRLLPKPEPIYLGELLGAAVSSLGDELRDRKLELEASAKGFEIEADPALMTQVFKNIIRNFNSYTKAGSTLTVGAERAPGLEGDGPVDVVRFEDDGPGAPPSELPRLFDTFYRGSSGQAAKGSGLGLAICKGIVEAHGGSVSAGSGPGRGLAVTIRLPGRGSR